MNPPKGIDPKVWEMVVEAIADATGYHPSCIEHAKVDVETMCYHFSTAMAQSAEAERESIADMVEHMLRFADTTSGADEAISQAIRNRSNTTTERNEG